MSDCVVGPDPDVQARTAQAVRAGAQVLDVRIPGWRRMVTEYIDVMPATVLMDFWRICNGPTFASGNPSWGDDHGFFPLDGDWTYLARQWKQAANT